MIKKLFFLTFANCFFLTLSVFPQAKPIFSGDPANFKEELSLYMGPELPSEQTDNLNSFISKWDSTVFNNENKSSILDISVKLANRQLRAVPHYAQFLEALNTFSKSGKNNTDIKFWLAGITKMLSDPKYLNAAIIKYIQNTISLLKENLLINTASVKWKVKNADLKFAYDTTFYVYFKNATLTSYAQRDSSEIYKVSGSYLPVIQEFFGKTGLVTWEKAGFSKEDVYAQISHYNINLNRNNFTCDSAKFMHRTYFKEPVYGRLSDRTISVSNPEKATFPQFETYTKHFKIKGLYNSIDYEGGLAFEGSQTKGKGEKGAAAKITFYRNDTLVIKLASNEFSFSKTGLNSQETAATLYLGKDSIYHSSLGFSYNVGNRQVNLFRTNNPVSGSPYYNTYHNVDMYFENLTWDMNGSKIIISRPRGAAMGQATFRSSSFYNEDYFLKLMSLDEYHPLTRLIKFSEYYYSDTFPVSEFAKWLNKSEELVTALCIDMANKGFVFYDRTNQEVTIKSKTKDYINSYAGKKDYDVISIYSEAKSPHDNAILDLKNYRLTVMGVTQVVLSDSQKVAIFPYNKELTIEKNRNISFDGVVAAGLFTIFGHNFRFSYDTFALRLQNIDSLTVAVESDTRDAYGNPLITDVTNIIQLAKGELYIDEPDNKSGMKALPQYPIFNATSPSYIFYDRIPGLAGIYSKKDFYLRIDPFSVENTDHAKKDDISFSGMFYAGNILKPTAQHLTVQENNSLGFNMVVPEEGLDVYDGKGKIYDFISMSDMGLIGSGTLKRLSSVTTSEEYKFFPDSMLTQAATFDISKDAEGRFPELNSQDVKIKWMPQNDDWFAYNSKDKTFNMFENGTQLDGSLNLSPSLLSGAGNINMPESNIRSDHFTFSTNEIKADTADYNLKSTSTSGYAFVAENANTDINFALKKTSFHLNTDSSFVKFPEIQYLCKMADFEYDMQTKLLKMEQRGKSATAILAPDKLLRVNFKELDKPTFISTNDLKDTITFNSSRAVYHLDQEYIEAENINYIHIADALIQPENGKITIRRHAKIDKLQNAYVAVNNRHLLYSANIDIESTKRYSGSAKYDYITETNDIEPVSFPQITVDTSTTVAKGFISEDQKFMLSPAFNFAGDISLSARNENILFTGSAGVIHDCNTIKSYPVKFKSIIDPKNVMIPISEKPRDENDNLVISGSFINIDSTHVYSAFLSPQKAWSDAGLVSASGVLFYNKNKESYQITSREKAVDPTLNGNIVTLDKRTCNLSGEGKLNFGANFGLAKMTSAGTVINSADSGKVNVHAILSLDFFFSPAALKIMSDEIRMIPSLKPVNQNSEFNNKGMKDIFGTTTASRMKEDIDLFGTTKNLPKEFSTTLLLNDVNLYWNESSSSFRSKGKIGLGFIGSQAINVYVDGFIEIQRKRSGDLIDIYLKANESTWYYFSYFSGVMMAQAGNLDFNKTISEEKTKDRKHPEASSRVPYTYMIAVENKLAKFLKRMTVEEETESSPFDQQIK